MIQVSTGNHTDDLRAIESNNDNDTSRLRVYTADCLTWRNVTLPHHTPIDFKYSKLAFDGHTNIFMASPNDSAVHVGSLSRQYYER